MSRRVAIIADAREHLGPDLARKLASRGHDLVLGAPAHGLVRELEKAGAKVAVSETFSGPEDLATEGVVDSLADLAVARFGGFHAAFIRPAVHINGDILTATTDDMRHAFEGNMLPAFLALKALLPRLIEQGEGGQILIGSSGTGVRPARPSIQRPRPGPSCWSATLPRLWRSTA